ncbi:MAG TPA: hypothetical protein DD433_01460 [Ruminococcaceae bacterium]|nr:hypothetical protein [Oscillospiraceae bacterium]
MDRKLKIWLWLSIVLTVAGALFLYPIGTTALNCIFIAVKIGMVSGLLVLLFQKGKAGLLIWALCSAGAVVMTIAKWSIAGRASVLFAVSILVDVCMPAGAYAMLKGKKK